MKRVWVSLIAVFAICATLHGQAQGQTLGQQILEASNIPAGLCVIDGLGDSGALAGNIAATGKFVVQQLETDATQVKSAQDALHARELYGAASVDIRDSKAPLPYAENLVNIYVANCETDSVAPISEILRVTRPLGFVFLKVGGQSRALKTELKNAGIEEIKKLDSNGSWLFFEKPWPEEMDEWNHPRHSPSNNAVSTDELVAPPRRIRWVTGPLGVMSDLVSARGRNFYGDVVARDAFNGLPLWDKKMGQGFGNAATYHFNPGSVRAVADGDRLYVVDNGLLQAVDGGTGEVLQTYPEAGWPTDGYFVDVSLVIVDSGSVRVIDVETVK